jgi:hypothetical protein
LGSHLSWVDVVDEEISLAEQTLKDFLSALVCEIERNTAFVGVQVEEQTALFWVGHPSGERATLASHIATTWVFDLNNFCSHVGHEFGCVCSSDHVPALDNPEAFQGASRHRTSFFSLPPGKSRWCRVL